jgi:hypothetical protein
MIKEIIMGAFKRLEMILIIAAIFIYLNLLCANGIINQTNEKLSPEYQQKLKDYASASIRYFTSSQSNNLEVGFSHSYFGTGKFLIYDVNSKNWIENKNWNMTRGYGSYTNMNEVTLRFLALASAYKMNWLNYLPEEERYNKSWGQILIGLRTMRSMQTSGNADQFYQGHYYRLYDTAIKRGDLDSDRHVSEIVRPSNIYIQSSDDNALPFMNLLVLEGLANDSSVYIPDRDTIKNLCREIRDHIELRSFVINNSIVMNFQDGKPSIQTWDRISTEGPIILASPLLSGQINKTEFDKISLSLMNMPVNWSSYNRDIIKIGKPSYHSAMFMHGLRPIHGLPVTSEEYPGLNFFDTSTKPILEAQIDYADHYGFKALGSQVMSQTLNGTSLVERNGVLVQFPGNEENKKPLLSYNLSKATAPHAWFMPLARWRYLNHSDIDKIFLWAAEYEKNFFHSGSNINNEFGWEAAIPWAPNDTTYAWKASDGSWRYTDMGRPFEALNTAYIVLSIFDALNPDRPLASYNIEAERLKNIASCFDNMSPISAVFKDRATS